MLEQPCNDASLNLAGINFDCDDLFNNQFYGIEDESKSQIKDLKEWTGIHENDDILVDSDEESKEDITTGTKVKGAFSVGHRSTKSETSEQDNKSEIQDSENVNLESGFKQHASLYS